VHVSLSVSAIQTRFTRQHLWHNIDTVLREALCEMKLDSFCHLQGEKIPKIIPVIKSFSPCADLKELILNYAPTWIELPHKPYDLKSIILRNLDHQTTLLPNILNSKHLTCIVLHLQTMLNVESLTKWLEESPFYPSLRTFGFGVRTDQGHISETFISTNFLLFLSRHNFLTYLDVDLYIDSNFERFAAILREMKALEFFGFGTRVESEWDHPDHENIFEYLQPLLSALPSRLGALEIGTWYWLETLTEVRRLWATREHSN